MAILLAVGTYLLILSIALLFNYAIGELNKRCPYEEAYKNIQDDGDVLY